MASAPLLPPEASRRTLVVSGARSDEVVAFESHVVDFFIEAARLLGAPRSLAAIYGVVFASPVPLSFADICARLDLSKGSVSQGLRTLREVDALVEVSRPEDPAELFAPNLEMRRLIGRYLSGRLDPQLKTGRDRLSALEARVSLLPAAERKLLSPRLKKMRSWHTKTRALLPLVKTYLKLGN